MIQRVKSPALFPPQQDWFRMQILFHVNSPIVWYLAVGRSHVLEGVDQLAYRAIQSNCVNNHV